MLWPKILVIKISNIYSLFSLIGNSGGEQLNLSDYSIVVPSKNTAHVQEAQICIGHIIMHLIEDKLKEKSFI